MDRRIKYSIFLLLFSVALSINTIGQTNYIISGAIWTYLDDGTDQGTAWYASDFDDNNWDEGPSQLGYGDGDEATVINSGGSNKHTTYYFRHEFEAENVNQNDFVLLKLLRDDGAVVYLNGEEIIRSNMPNGIITYQTFAAGTVSGSGEDTYYEYFIPSETLVEGTNLIAVEVHQRSSSSSDVSLNLKLQSTTTIPPITRKAPYLIFSGIKDEMIINWQLFSTKTCKLEWGKSFLLGTQTIETTEYGNDHQHTFTFTNLDLATKYYYRWTCEDDTISGFFRTAPEEDEKNLTFFAYGDTRSQPVYHDRVAEQIVTNYMVDEDAMSFILSSGDLVNNGDNEEDWDMQFFDSNFPNIQEMLRTLPYFACMGNHEGNGLLFQKYFPYPFYSSKTYWSVDYGPAHFIILDQYTSYTPGSTQYEWLINDLKTSTKDWKFLLLHAPGWSAGDGHANNTIVQNVLQPLCVEYGIQFVIAGHNHYYARAMKDNVVHITAGGGGAPLYNPIASYPNIVKVDKSYNFCKLAIKGDSLHFSAINRFGDIIEEFYYENSYHTGIDPIHEINTLDNIVIHPNPFSCESNIDLYLHKDKYVKIAVYNMYGKQISLIENMQKKSGNYHYEWNGTDKGGAIVSKGVYFINVYLDDICRTHKVVFKGK